MNPVLDRLPILVLEPHGRCNCRCVMCDIWKNTDARELSAADLERHLEDIEHLHVEWVVFSGGEPLMHADLFRLAAMLRRRSIRVTLLSTGLLLERYAAQIRTNIDDVIVSLDGPAAIHDEIRGVPGAFARLRAGVRALAGHPVSARCTVQARNAGHLRETVETARQLALDSISFLAADLTSTAFNRPLVWPAARQSAVAPELAAVEHEIESLIAAYPEDGFVRESPAKLRRIAAHFRAHYGLEAHTAPRCNAPWVSAVVEANGDVRPCFFHPAVGNAATGLARAINGAAAVAFREALDVATDPTCRKCVCSLYV
jgi:MoaA/NifB/PqqE/SkfB family radical SAM enzyme